MSSIVIVRGIRVVIAVILVVRLGYSGRPFSHFEWDMVKVSGKPALSLEIAITLLLPEPLIAIFIASVCRKVLSSVRKDVQN